LLRGGTIPELLNDQVQKNPGLTDANRPMFVLAEWNGHGHEGRGHRNILLSGLVTFVSSDLQYCTLVRRVAVDGRLEEPAEPADDVLDLALLDHRLRGPEILHPQDLDHDPLEVLRQQTGPLLLAGQTVELRPSRPTSARPDRPGTRGGRHPGPAA